MELFHKMISGSLGIPERQIASTLHLLGEGATIPFISRYRKEATGGLDEVQIEQIKEQHDSLRCSVPVEVPGRRYTSTNGYWLCSG